MFRKLLIAGMFATAAGYCFAAETLPEVVTSEVFYRETGPEYVTVETPPQEIVYEDPAPHIEYAPQYEYIEQAPPAPIMAAPVWPIAGSDADVYVSCEGGAAECSNNKKNDNIRIVSKIGDDLIVENNFNMGGVRGDFNGWSGGANMLHGAQVPMGFLDECNDGAAMPLLRREMPEDDGGEILAVARSGNKRCGTNGAGGSSSIVKIVDDGANDASGAATENEIGVNASADAEAPRELTDQVRSWVVASGQTLREVLQSWSDKEGWDLVWATSREYPIEASAVFKGRFVDVASALVRNFGRATPVPYAKFYKGNRVLVINTIEE